MPLPSPQHSSTRAIPSRRSLYRRALLRKGLAGLLTIIAVWLFTTVLGLTHGAEASAWVTIRDMEAGEQLTENDVRSVPIEASLLTPSANAITREYLASGNVLTAPITSGEVVTASRLRSPDSFDKLPANRRAVRIPLADVGSASILRAGSHVDIHSPPTALSSPLTCLFFRLTRPPGTATPKLLEQSLMSPLTEHPSSWPRSAPQLTTAAQSPLPSGVAEPQPCPVHCPTST
ncbi:Flp pilus assembly protein CpaB [Dermatophilus congolensis]|uniref:Flp pilus assembly protein CpaB n=1 Tax=Dermatophilus congolensis TaxID=1863 RepID=A0AA46H0W0_9MICO|nr:SAF domain-containing protein [Dermatophilus congolensis]STD11396.1 Flp pilus assembly protein CpaB [Dermatophilus congolensis]